MLNLLSRFRCTNAWLSQSFRWLDRCSGAGFHSLCGAQDRPSPLANQCCTGDRAIRNVSPSGPFGSGLLQALPVPLLQLVSGFKVKGRLKRRCKDCYFVVRQQRLYVICKTHPRHKQMSMKKHERNTWILTDATQGKVRAW